MCPSLALEGLDGIYSYSEFKTSSVIGRCLVNVNIIAKKERPLLGGQKHKIAAFSKTVLTIVSLFSYVEKIE
jgi:hypothetical protein